MAIAIDATSNGSENASTTLTFAHTCTGSNLYLIVYFWTNQTDVGVTYNSVAMTKLSTNPTESNGRLPCIYGLANPATGANNIVITVDASGQIYAAAASYTGCSATQPDSQNKGNVTNQATITGTTTVVAANSWTVMGVVSGTDDNLGTGSAGADTTLRKITPSNGTLYDSNGALAAGDRSLVATLTAAATDDMSQVIVSLAPFTETLGIYTII